MTEHGPDKKRDLPGARRRFIVAASFFIGSFVAMNAFVVLAKGMGGLGPATFRISIAILVVLASSWVWFLVALYRSAKALGFGRGAVLLVLVSILPLFAFIAAVWMFHKLNQEPEDAEGKVRA